MCGEGVCNDDKYKKTSEGAAYFGSGARELDLRERNSSGEGAHVGLRVVAVDNTAELVQISH